MMPSRFWASTKGSIMPFSCAMRRIQRSERMAILVFFCTRGSSRLLDERTAPLNHRSAGLVPVLCLFPDLRLRARLGLASLEVFAQSRGQPLGARVLGIGGRC